MDPREKTPGSFQCAEALRESLHLFFCVAVTGRTGSNREKLHRVSSTIRMPNDKHIPDRSPQGMLLGVWSPANGTQGPFMFPSSSRH